MTNLSDILPESTDHLRVPPHSTEAEQSLLGSLLLDNTSFDAVGSMIAEADFYEYRHRLAYAAITGLKVAKKPADVVTVAADNYLGRSATTMLSG